MENPSKPASIVWKNSGNMFPLCGKVPETCFHCVETPELPSPYGNGTLYVSDSRTISSIVAGFLLAM